LEIHFSYGEPVLDDDVELAKPAFEQLAKLQKIKFFHETGDDDDDDETEKQNVVILRRENV